MKNICTLLTFKHRNLINRQLTATIFMHMLTSTRGGEHWQPRSATVRFKSLIVNITSSMDVGMMKNEHGWFLSGRRVAGPVLVPLDYTITTFCLFINFNQFTI